MSPDPNGCFPLAFVLLAALPFSVLHQGMHSWQSLGHYLLNFKQTLKFWFRGSLRGYTFSYFGAQRNRVGCMDFYWRKKRAKRYSTSLISDVSLVINCLCCVVFRHSLAVSYNCVRKSCFLHHSMVAHSMLDVLHVCALQCWTLDFRINGKFFHKIWLPLKIVAS